MHLLSRMVKILKKKRPTTPGSSNGTGAAAVKQQSSTFGAKTEHALVSNNNEGPRVDPIMALRPSNADVKGSIESVGTSVSPVPSTDGLQSLTEDKKDKVPIFKDPNFVHSNKSGQSAKKTRVWKNLKQIVTAERTLGPLGPNDVLYSAIDAPPSFFPTKKYSDISGLEAKYTDPQTKMRYTTTEEYARIRTLPADLVAEYLAIRKANIPVP